NGKIWNGSGPPLSIWTSAKATPLRLRHELGGHYTVCQRRPLDGARPSGARSTCYRDVICGRPVSGVAKLARSTSLFRYVHPSGAGIVRSESGHVGRRDAGGSTRVRVL